MRSAEGLTVVVMQPYFLPYRNYYALVRRADVFVIYDDVQYTKGWQQRNQILRPDGLKSWMTLPVLSSRPERQLIKDARLPEEDASWRRQILVSIRDSYRKHKWFDAIFPGFESVFLKGADRLVDITIPLLRWSTAQLGPKEPQWLLSSELGVTGADPSDRLLRICQKLGATAYLSGPAAKDYLDVRIFEEAGIGVEWNLPAFPDYPQLLSRRFDHHVSILDLLMNCGRESARYLEPSGVAGRA